MNVPPYVPGTIDTRDFRLPHNFFFTIERSREHLMLKIPHDAKDTPLISKQASWIERTLPVDGLRRSSECRWTLADANAARVVESVLRRFGWVHEWSIGTQVLEAVDDVLPLRPADLRDEYLGWGFRTLPGVDEAHYENCGIEIVRRGRVLSGYCGAYSRHTKEPDPVAWFRRLFGPRAPAAEIRRDLSGGFLEGFELDDKRTHRLFEEIRRLPGDEFLGFVGRWSNGEDGV